MRWHVVRTLVHKEFLRNLSNRGGLALALLLVGMAALLAAFGGNSSMQTTFGMSRGANRCYIDYWDDSPWVEHLKRNVPESMRPSVHFRDIRREYAGREGTVISYPPDACAIQMRPAERPNGPLVILCWHPGDDHGAMAKYESWFWCETRNHFRAEIECELAHMEPNVRSDAALPLQPDEPGRVWEESHELFLRQVAALKAKLPPESASRIHVPALTIDRQRLKENEIGTRTTISAALVLFALFFVCVYMLPSLACEERESGVLLAQALSPASPTEIITARLLFYPVIAVAFAALLGGLTKPHALLSPFFWLTLAVLAFGSMGIGMTIACVAKTQRAASMTALCYLLIVSLCVLICQQANIWLLPQFFVEFHGPRMLNAAMTGQVSGADYMELAITTGLAIFWNAAATISFRRFGWQ